MMTTMIGCRALGLAALLALGAAGCVTHMSPEQIQALGAAKNAASGCLYYAGPWGKGAVVIAFNSTAQGTVTVEDCKTAITTGTAPALVPVR